jgi:hypothetical protein
MHPHDVKFNEGDRMPQYLLSIYQPDGAPPAPEVLGAIMRDVGAVRDEMKAAGAWVFTAGLHPASSSTVVRFKDGKALTTDVGGFTIIQAADLDAALEWSGKLSRATTLPIEVRPLHAGAH